jgi:aspartate aminotransferase-like enzyme
VGCIGAIDEHAIRAAVHAIGDTLAEQDIRNVAPAMAVKARSNMQ